MVWIFRLTKGIPDAPIAAAMITTKEKINPVKYAEACITFAEVPDEICLTYSITGCRNNCRGCHSPWLREYYGRDLMEDLASDIEKNSGYITCVCFLGEGNCPSKLADCIQIVKNAGLKVCLYSGADKLEDIAILSYPEADGIDYLKIGSYQERLGGLTSPVTNQHMYRMEDGIIKEDITHKFK
jgi:anaerobic ribonucleoside-triphosphate reductase activating protein